MYAKFEKELHYRVAFAVSAPSNDPKHKNTGPGTIQMKNRKWNWISMCVVFLFVCLFRNIDQSTWVLSGKMSEGTSGSPNEQTGNNEGRYRVVQKFSRTVLLTTKITTHLWPRYSIYSEDFFNWMIFIFYL